MKKYLAIIILSKFSILNAIYLTIAAIKSKSQGNEKLFCDVNDKFSCSGLFQYDFAWIFGLPFASIALFVYPIIILLSIYGIIKKINSPFKIILALAIGGISFNGYVIYNEFIVNVFCLACLACALSIFIIGVLSIIGINTKK